MIKAILLIFTFLISSLFPKNVFALPSTSATSYYTNYSSTPVDTTTPLTIFSSAPNVVRAVQIFDSSGQVMKFTITSGPYVTTYYMPRGGDNLTLKLSKGDSLTIVGVTGTADTGENIITLLY